MAVTLHSLLFVTGRKEVPSPSLSSEYAKLKAPPIEGKTMENTPKSQPSNPEKGTPWGLVLVMSGFFVATGLVIAIGIISLQVGLASA